MYKHYLLNNGIRIITDQIPHSRSVSVGLWFRAGSAYESPEENGLSHFIEHMLFKGTMRRTARNIAEAMDSVGGQLNAFTAKEYTCFYCKVMDEHLELSLDLLSDMLLYSLFDPTEMEKEKQVILEEIHMYDDSPEDLVHELLSEAFFGNHPLAKPILGSPERLLQYSRSDLLDFMNKFYTTDNLVIAIAGNVHDEKLLLFLEKSFGNWQQRGSIPQEVPASFNEPRILYAKKDIEQFHLSLTFPGIASNNDYFYPMLVMNNLFGGGMSSRLFQKIREDRGLAYSIFSYPSNYLSDGMFSIYAAMKPEQSEEVLRLILEEILLLKEKGFTEEEFLKAREQLKGNYILGNETTGSRMNAIGKTKLMMEKVYTPSEIIEKISRIQPEQVNAIIQETFRLDKACTALVGSTDQTSKIWELIKRGV